MKTKVGLAVIALFMGIMGLQAQKTVTVRATSYDISDNLDLEAVASVFGDARNLEEFEQMLNDPELQLSNLDLNRDGYVDYLRVVETSSSGVHVIAIQAVLGQDIFQDVATIDVERKSSGTVVVQVIGDPYIYGLDYIIQPVYVVRPVIFGWFWRPYYVNWISPYYWNYYPGYYNCWTPRPTFVYHNHVHVHVNVRNSYHHVHHREVRTASNLHSRISRNDYASRNPQSSFRKRNGGVENKRQLVANRGVARPAESARSRTENRTANAGSTRSAQRAQPAQRNAEVKKRGTAAWSSNSRPKVTEAQRSSNYRKEPARTKESSPARQDRNVQQSRLGKSQVFHTSNRSTSTPQKQASQVRNSNMQSRSSASSRQKASAPVRSSVQKPAKTIRKSSSSGRAKATNPRAATSTRR